MDGLIDICRDLYADKTLCSIQKKAVTGLMNGFDHFDNKHTTVDSESATELEQLL